MQFLPLNDPEQLAKALRQGDICAVIVEGIQGVGGLDIPSIEFLQLLESKCRETGTALILDEIQSGYGRSGKFFAHQYAGIKPDIITVAKGMGNGFPVAGVLISPEIKAKIGMLGTTFGGNPLACAAGLAVLEIMESESLIENAAKVGQHLTDALSNLHENPEHRDLIHGANANGNPSGARGGNKPHPSDSRISRIKGNGLMLGVELHTPVAELRRKLLFDHHIFTGSASNPNLIRILPPLGITYDQAEPFVHAMKTLIS